MDVVSTPLVEIRTVCALALIFFLDMASAIVETSRQAPTITTATRNELDISHFNTSRTHSEFVWTNSKTDQLLPRDS